MLVVSLTETKELISISVAQTFQVFLGHSGTHDIEGNELPRLVYVSREKRPGYQHHKKAGAENALVIRYITEAISQMFCSLLRKKSWNKSLC